MLTDDLDEAADPLFQRARGGEGAIEISTTLRFPGDDTGHPDVPSSPLKRPSAMASSPKGPTALVFAFSPVRRRRAPRSIVFPAGFTRDDCEARSGVDGGVLENSQVGHPQVVDHRSRPNLSVMSLGNGRAERANRTGRSPCSISTVRPAPR